MKMRVIHANLTNMVKLALGGRGIKKREPSSSELGVRVVVGSFVVSGGRPLLLFVGRLIVRRRFWAQDQPPPLPR